MSEVPGGGWIPFVRCLSPDEVIQVSRDLALVGEADVRLALTEGGFWTIDDLDYVLFHLAEAKSFVDDLAARGEGLVYLIG